MHRFCDHVKSHFSTEDCLPESFTIILAKSLPLPVENEESRPRVDLVVFIINLTSELSFQSAEASLKYLDPGYFLGKACFMVTNGTRAF
uniref:Centromere protein M n=1 Tax=Salarias fasciatus TaxID=181472 RepID=A0A672GWL7_SALFA